MSVERRVRWWDVRGMAHTTLTGRCPACHAESAFEGAYRVREVCGACGVRFERDEGSFLGALAVAYGFTILVLLALLAWLLPRFGLFDGLGLTLIAVAVVTVPVVYRPAKAWWLWWLWAAGFVKRDDEVAEQPQR